LSIAANRLWNAFAGFGVRLSFSGEIQRNRPKSWAASAVEKPASSVASKYVATWSARLISFLGSPTA